MSASATVFEIKRFAVHDGPGIRTTLFLKGCPLRCLWCHNPEGISSQKSLGYFAHKCISCGRCVNICPHHAHRIQDGQHFFDREKCTSCGLCESYCFNKSLTLYGKTISADEARRIVLEDVDFYEPEGGVTLSGGEPMMQFDFCHTLFSILQKDHIHTALDTCLFARRDLYQKMLPITSLFLVDVKHANDLEHRRLTKQSNRLIFDNLKYLSDSGASIEIRIPFVPGYNDSDENMHQTGEKLSNLRLGKVKLLPFHAFARSKYRAVGMNDTIPDVAPPDERQIDRAVKILRSYGLKAYSGRS